MCNTLSMDLRVRFKQLIDDGMCAATAGRSMPISPANAARLGQRRPCASLFLRRYWALDKGLASQSYWSRSVHRKGPAVQRGL